ncbi:MAG: hypothetical protein ACRDSM_11755, partial [Pseudonocardiaceae bacterium]
MQDRHWLPGLETGGRVALVQKVSIHREIGCPLTGEVICVPYTRLHRAAKGVRDLGIPPAPRAATIHAVTDAIGADLSDLPRVFRTVGLCASYAASCE